MMIPIDEIRAQIEPGITKILDDAGLELFDLLIQYRGATVAIQVFADRSRGGITIGECAAVNRQINQFLEKDGGIGGDYMVEVFSPGLDRPLKNTRDFARIVGAEVDFFLSTAVEGRLTYRGVVKSATETTVVIEFQGADVAVPYEAIGKAVQVIE